MSSEEEKTKGSEEEKILTAEQIEQYQRDGFLVVRAGQVFRSEEERQQFIAWSIEVCQWPEIRGKWMQYFEKSLIDGHRMLNRVEKFLDFHPELQQLFCSRQGRIQQLIREALGDGQEVVLFKEKINYKLAGGDGFKPHQDAQAGWDRYGHTIHFNLLIAIDAASQDNGCLELVPGRHREGLLGPMWQELPAELVAQLSFVPVPIEPGDMVIFDSFVPHRSGANLTALPRRAMYITYNYLAEGDFRHTYFADKRASFPPDIERLPGVDYQYKI